MTTRYVVQAGSRRHTVQVREVGDAYEISIDGEVHAVDAKRIGATTVTSLIVGTRSYEIGTVQDGDRIDVYVQGEIHPVLVYDEIWARAKEGHAARATDGEDIHAPIPGSVVRILVNEGDIVAAGAPVAVLEAMKMQNELLSRNGGVVASILVAPGDIVSTGQKLVVLKSHEGDGAGAVP